MTREEAINEIKSWDFLEGKEIEAIHTLIPELAESEDERIRKHIVEILDSLPGGYWYGQKEKDDSLSYLERQKGQKDYRKLYEDIAQSEWFKKAYAGKSLGEEFEQKPAEENPSEKELAEVYAIKLEEKFPVLPTLKGKQLADFKNFLNKCRQIFGLTEYGVHPTQAKLFDQLALVWATWGAEHLAIGKVNGDADMDKPVEWSEEDERIRKALIDALTVSKSVGELKFILPEPTREECLAWLEKQKENIENEYVFRPLAGTDITIAAEQAIRRAKEGDHLVLAFNGVYLPVREYNSAKDLVDEYDAYLEKRKEQKPRWEINIPYTTKWTKEMIDEKFEKLVEPKPSEWSEEDERMFEGFMHKLEVCDLLTNKEVAWAKRRLNSLHPQPKAEWSEEDERMLSRCIKSVECSKQFADSETYKAAKDAEMNWLKSFRNRPIPSDEKCECREVAWSEEDENNMGWLIAYLRGKNVYHSDALHESVIKWLKSLRPKPKQEWSEEDEEMFDAMIDMVSNSLYEPLCPRDEMLSWLKAFRYSQKLNEEEIKKIRSEEYTKGFNDAAFGSKQEWDEFDEDCLKRAIWYVENPAPSAVKDTNLALWLKALSLNRKKINEDVEKLCSNEWSEEDEEMLVRLLDSISIGNNYEEMRNWLLPKLKSLKPQPHTVSIKDATKFGNLEYERGVKDGIQSEKSRQWKPTEEQMRALSDTLEDMPEHYKPKCTLESLERDLKKL